MPAEAPCFRHRRRTGRRRGACCGNPPGVWVLWSIAKPEPLTRSDSQLLRCVGQSFLYCESLGGFSHTFKNLCVNIFIDVDYTLLAANGSLRPHARELLIRLREAGHVAYVWSGVGIRKDEMSAHDLDQWVEDYFIKPLEDFRAAVARLHLPVNPDLIVDDHAEIVRALGGVAVRPYFFEEASDRELRRAADALLAYATSGSCDDPSFTVPPGERSGAPA